MKIALLDTTLGGELIGGAQTFLIKLVGGLSANGHVVHLICKGTPNEKIRDQIQVSGAILHSDLWDTNGLVDETAPVLAAWLNDLRPDIFVVSVSADIGWVVLPLLDSRIATLAVGHTDSQTFYAPAEHYKRFLTRVVGASDEVCKNYEAKCGIDVSCIDWIPYGVRASETVLSKAGGGPLKMIYVGRIDEPQKRISDLIKVVKTLKQNGVSFTIDIVGDGDEMPLLKDELAGEIASRDVVLHGWLESSDVIKLLRQAELFTLTSAYEGFCIALVESMANGCSPIVTDIKSGNRQLVFDGENGFIAPIGDTLAFAKKIEHLANNPATLLEFRQKAWEIGKQYSVQRMVKAYESAFDHSMKDVKLQPRQPDLAFPLMESCRSKYPLGLRRLKAKVLSNFR